MGISPSKKADKRSTKYTRTNNDVVRKIEKMDINLLHGDCLELMKDIPDKSIDMILCDLPYGTTDCKWDSIIPFEPLWKQYERIIKDNGCIALFSSKLFTGKLMMSNEKLFKYDLVWQKDKPTNFARANKEPMKYHENILIFYKKQPVYNKQMIERTGGGKNRYKTGVNHSNRKMQGSEKVYSNENDITFYDQNLKNPSMILDFDTGRRQDLVHPTQKPIRLIEWLIKTYTNEGDTVLDNCMGSGTTGVACINLNRNFIGIELDDEYFEIAKQRISEAQNKPEQITMFDISELER
jgi:site-specific DNA-methyltransferase (adenine-specific)